MTAKRKPSTGGLSTHSTNALDAPPSPNSSNLLSFPRAPSPSGFQGFLTKSARWLSRTTSAPKAPSPESRPRLSGSQRRPTISGPTDPRPILAVPNAGLGASQSVLDLSQPLERIDDQESPTPSDLGDLNATSTRTWSRSVDDLSTFANAAANNATKTAATKAKIDNYRGGSPATATKPLPHPVPFPSITRQTSPRLNTSSPVTLPNGINPSPSSPTFTYRVKDASSPDFSSASSHARSKSHGAQQATPSKQATLVPPSPPKRIHPEPALSRRRTSSEREKEKRMAGFNPFTFTPRSANGTPPNDAYGLRSNGSPKAEKASPSGSFSALPTTKSNKEAARQSQIIHCSGFLNRFTLSPKFSAQGLSSDKGWKPYKAQLQGSKIYFYKPPADRVAEIKDLFLTGLAPVTLEAKDPGGTANSDPPEGTSRERSGEGKRKRAYWGRARHAELVVSADENVASGSPDALIHEVVFATCFKITGNSTTPTKAEVTKDPEYERWRHFATAVLLCLPFLVEKDKFEAEVVRDVNSFERGATEEERTIHQARLEWFALEYIRLHGKANNEEEWASLSKSTPKLSVCPPSPRPTAHVGDSELAASTPRRKPMKRPSVERGSSTDSVGRSASGFRIPEEGLSRETFMRFDLRRFAECLAHFNKTHLVDVVAADFLTAPEYGDTISAFSGSDDRPHWLTRLVVDMILGQVGKSDSKTDDTGESSGSRIGSATYARAGAVSRWIQLAETCRLTGDLCSWRAIMSALCCIPIARLEKVWKRVEQTDLQTVEEWVREEKRAEGEVFSPWVGDVRTKVTESLASARVGKAGQLLVQPMVTVGSRVEAVVTSWKACLESVSSKISSPAEAATLVQFFANCHRDATPKLASINQMLPISFAVEPRQRGRFQPYFWKPQTSHGPAQPILPLLFPEPLPTVCLLDRNTLIRTKKESLLSSGVSSVEINELQVQQLTASKSAKDLHRGRNLAETDLEETLIPCFNGELMLKLPRDDVKSRPTSIIDSAAYASPPAEGSRPARGNSIRLSPAARLERKGSQLRPSRRSSLPSISQRNSLLIPEAPPVETNIRVSIKSGTLDRLVDVLVTGLEGVGVTHADDNGEMPLRDGKTKTFKVDRAEFARVWWTGFRSFVTPLVLFELLRKRYVSTIPAGDRTSHHVSFATPSPSKTPDPITGQQLRLDILSTLKHWLVVGGGAQDVLDDFELYQAMKAFLSTEAKQGPPEVDKARESLLTLFIRLTSRPELESCPNRERDSSSNGSESVIRKFGTKPPDLDATSADEFVDNLDSIAQTVFRGVSEAHMFELADILEAQTADRTGWFAMRDLVPPSEDAVVVQDFYFHLQHVEPSPLLNTTHHDHLYRLLSPSLRTVVRTHNSMRDWVVSKIADPGIEPSVRLARCELLLKALEECRTRAYDGDGTSSTTDIQQPAIRSFVEAVLVSAVLSPESRTYVRTWHEVAANRNCPLDDLISMLSRSETAVSSSKRLTVDPSWVIERMLEVITLPDVLESEDGQSLVNLDKRRYLHNLIVNTAGLVPRTRKATETERQDMERWNAMAREAHQNTYDYRSVRDTAQREMAQASLNYYHHGKKLIKPFSQLVTLQMEKTKRDKYLRDKLLKEKKTEQLRSDKRASLLNKAMQPHKPHWSGQKHLRQKRSVSGMYSLFRPLSVAFGASTEKYGPPPDGPRRTAAELDFPAVSAKAALTINLAGAGIRNFINDQRPFTLQIDTEDGGHYLLQAVGAAERDRWMSHIKKTSEALTLKRRTYLGKNALPAYNEMVDFSGSGPVDPSGLFGHDIMTVLLRESPTGEYIPGSIPRVVELCIAEIERRGLTEVGIFRIAGSKSVSNSLRAEFIGGQPIDLSLDGKYSDIYVIGDVLKQWFRELPQSVFTNDLYATFVQCMKIPDYDERKSRLRSLIWQLPPQNFDVLRRIIELLDHVVDYEDQNQMSPDALAICFNVTLCKPPLLASFGDMQHTVSLVKHCIIHYHYLFSEPEADQDQDEAVPVQEVEEDEANSDAGESPVTDTPSDPEAPDNSLAVRAHVGESIEASATETSLFWTAQENASVDENRARAF